jgi:hypothetical protein
LTPAGGGGRIRAVPKVDIAIETTLPPDTVRGALLDFSERRPDIWPGLTRELYEVYSVGEQTADVKEGTKMPVGAVWARERYDWSRPDTIRWTVQQSNFCTPGSYVEAKLSPRADGGTHIDVHWERTGTSLMGKVATRLIAATNGKPVKASVEKALRGLEAVSPGGPGGAGPAPTA